MIYETIESIPDEVKREFYDLVKKQPDDTWVTGKSWSRDGSMCMTSYALSRKGRDVFRDINILMPTTEMKEVFNFGSDITREITRCNDMAWSHANALQRLRQLFWGY